MSANANTPGSRCPPKPRTAFGSTVRPADFIATPSSAKRPPAAARAADSKPSARLNPKTIKPLGMGKSKTAFSEAYKKGEVPCHLVHGSIKHRIAWSRQPETLPYHPLFLNLLEGLRETDHPFCFIVPEALREMLEADGAEHKLAPLMPLAVPPLRLALSSKSPKPVVLGALTFLGRLASAVEPECFVQHLGSFLPPIAPHALSRDQELRAAVDAALNTIETEIGEESLKMIKQKIPTYKSVLY